MTDTLGKTDIELKNAVSDELQWTPSVDSTHLEVTVSDGTITLSGNVDTYPQMLQAVKAARRVRGVTGLIEEIAVQHVSTTFQDADIVREATEALARAVDVPAQVKAAVRAGEVTLTGQVQWQHERENAARAVRYLRGISRIHNLIGITPTSTAAGLDSAISAALVRSAQLRGKNIHVTTDRRGHVTLRGSVASYADRSQAEHACWSAPGTTDVTNELHLNV